MCGIAGKLNFDPQQKVSPNLIQQMTQEVQYRGPDDEGVWVKDNIGLGHRRLSIIDLSAAGHQPMSNEDGSIWITFNGEIYNFIELKADLVKRGHRFTSHTDTEAIIHLYEEYGVDCLGYLRGMFAFAIWDDRKKCLFLARDRMGKKPLKYYLDNNCLVFASELKSILNDPGVSVEVDRQAIDAYLTYQYVPNPLTGFKNIKKLPHAHYLLWQDGHVTVNKYWTLDFSHKLSLSEGEMEEEIIRRLTEAVKLRLISDVPLGACLSGGIDSSAIVAIMSQLMDQPVKTFSIGFKDDEFNELPFARLIAEKFRTDHREFIVEPQAVEILPELVWHYEEPYADPSALPTYYLFRMMKSHVTVVLTGDAGDENFAGYNRYVQLKQMEYYRHIPAFIRSCCIESTLSLCSRLIRKDFFLKALNYSKSASNDTVNEYIRFFGGFQPQDKLRTYTDDFYSQSLNHDAAEFLDNLYRQAPAREKFDRILAVDFNSYLPDDLMVKVDIASMISSLECRAPMLDHKFLEFVAQIPFEYKLRRREKKYIFKRSLRNMLPHEVLYRKKMGFSVPIAGWFRKELKDFTYSHLLGSESLNRGYFRKEEIKRLLDEHTRGGIDHSFKIWALLWLEIWHRRFVDVSAWNKPKHRFMD